MYNLKEATLRRHATSRSWEEREDYYRGLHKLGDDSSQWLKNEKGSDIS